MKCFSRVVAGWALLGVVAVVGGGLLGGCVGGYSTWPPIESEKAGFTQINYVTGQTIVGEAVAMVVNRFTPDAKPTRGTFYEGQIALSLPKGATYETYGAVTRRIGANCEPSTAANTTLPTYLVDRVYIRGPVAEVDVYAPTARFGAGSEGGTPRYQKVTVYLAGGTKPWRVTSHRSFPVGLFDVPVRNEMPEWGGGPSNQW
jgi:hypothetical protein